jgi:hypothetical protein
MNEFRDIIEPHHHLLDRPLVEKPPKLSGSKTIEEKKEVNNTIPSTGFSKQLFANKDYYHQKHTELERERCGDYERI